MPPSSTNSNYGSIEEEEPLVEKQLTPKTVSKSPSTYQLSTAFQILSATVWTSMTIWGVWITTFYGKAAVRGCTKGDWSYFNIVFPDLWTSNIIASTAILTHLIGAAFMALAGAFQLVKYIRKHYAMVHRIVGRLYILAALIASIGGLIFIFWKGDYGGRPADYAFGTYGFIFLLSAIQAYRNAVKKDFVTHKLWAWRLYSLSLAGWMYRFNYYAWMLLAGHAQDPETGAYTSWLHSDNFQAGFDFFQNWAFYVPNLIVVEVVFRWGESAHIASHWQRILDVCYYLVTGLVVVYTIHAFFQLWVPSILGRWQGGWII